MKLYALLIGIDEYPYAPLNQCKNDIAKIETYLNSIRDKFDDVQILPLLDADASKNGVIDGITNFLGQANNDDVALMYYSGHGGQEETSGLFEEEYDGLMECLVCHSTEEMESGFLLADKEIRFLFSQLINDPHLITIFDCCHSGDMVRAFKKSPEKEAIRRIVDAFPSRDFEEFIFCDFVSKEDIESDGFVNVAPYKNHVHVAACLNTESSWEDEQGGVFTRYLIHLLKANNHQLNYLDIARWAKLSIKDVTNKKQTPVINVQGSGNMDAYSRWLNLEAGQTEDNLGKVVFNDTHGWIYSRGQLMGMQEGMIVNIHPDKDTTYEAIVTSVDLEDSTLAIETKDVTKLNQELSYDASTDQVFSPLCFYINDLDFDDEAYEEVKKVVASFDSVKLGDEGEADFFVNIFNKMVYVSLPETEFQPLARQIDLVKDEKSLSDKLRSQIPNLVKWNHFYTLENPTKDFDKAPLKVEFQVNGSDKWQDISNGKIAVEPKEERALNIKLFYAQFKVRVTNVTNEPLYVGVLTLNSDISITSYPWDSQVVLLEPGKPKLFYDHKASSLGAATIDYYKEIYNWKSEWFYYKFIINNYEDFTNSLNGKSFKQPPLDPPLTIEKMGRDMSPKGEMGFDEIEEKKHKWACMISRIELLNPEFNMITGELEELWDEYEASEELAPFIQMNYFEEVLNGTKIELKAKQNHNEDSEMASKATSNKIVIFANALFNRIRKRRFKRQFKKGGPVVVAEGDSWFLFPLPGVKDTIDFISRKYIVRSLADAGDEVEDYLEKGDLLENVKQLKPEYVLISGGGNDIVGEKIVDILIKGVKNGSQPSDYINEIFKQKMDRLKELYIYFFGEINKIESQTKIYIHGYDYIRHNPDKKTIKKGWANRYMIAAGITDISMREKIIHYLVDTFNNILKELDQNYDFVTYIDHRGTVAVDEWRDEIHPNNVGYGKVANNFLNAIKE